MRVPAWKPLATAGALAFAQTIVAAGPTAAAGPPVTVTVDMPSAVPAGHYWEFNDFFPRTLSVPQGATIQFADMGFHTATLLPAGVTARQDDRNSGLFVNDTDDPTANPGGQTHSGVNFFAALPTPQGCGFSPAPPCTFDGTSVVSDSPLGPPEPFAVTVTADPGTYVFHCRIHPGMTGHLTVVPSNETGTSASQISKRVDRQVAQDVAAGLAAEARAQRQSLRMDDGVRTWHVAAGTASPDGRTAVLEFLPRHLDIKTGDRVVFDPLAFNEPHTVTFPTDLGTDFVPSCEGAGGDTAAVPNHFPPSDPFDFSCPGPRPPDEVEFAPGNGVRNVTSPATVSDSGLIAPERWTRAYGLPGSAALNTWTVSFQGASAGSYYYICQIHGAPMDGTITVN